MLAQTNTTGIILVALGALAFALSILAFVLRNRARGKKAEVPNALRPGPADAALETPLLNRLQGWGVVLMTFFVIWFPLQWLFEPSRNLSQENELSIGSAGGGPSCQDCTPCWSVNPGLNGS